LKLSDTGADKFSIRFPVLGGAYFLAGRAAADLKQRLRDRGLPRQMVRRVVIAAYEVEMNICIHAVSGEIEMVVEGDHVRLRAEDRGPGIGNVEQALAAGFSTAGEKARAHGFGAGMGFVNMQRCADTFAVCSVAAEGTRVTMTFIPRSQDTVGKR